MSACDSTPDSGLSADQCISINDGSGPNWWMSPDIKLTDANGIQDQAITGSNNIVDVRSHRAAATCNLEGTENIIVELWVGNPALNMAPGVNTTPIFTKLIPVANFPAASSVLVSQAQSGGPGNIIWNPNPADPVQAPGHKCLIARSYPDTLAPDPTCFHVQQDSHVAQRNIAIVPVSPRQLQLNFPVLTSNTDLKLPEAVTLRVMADLNPSQKVLEILTPSLRQVPGFQRIARTTSGGFGVDLPDFPNAKVRDNTRLGCLGKILSALGLLGSSAVPTYEADVELKPRQVTNFTFKADFTGSQVGEAHVFYLMHVNSEQRVVGGLTVAAVVV